MDLSPFLRMIKSKKPCAALISQTNPLEREPTTLSNIYLHAEETINVGKSTARDLLPRLDCPGKELS